MSSATIATPIRALCLLAIALILPAVAAEAQDGGAQTPQARIQGVVVRDSNFEPIPDAVVTLVGTDIETRTGRMGDFAIADAPAGTSWVRVSVPGMPSVRERIEVGGDDVVFLQFQMPDDVTAFLNVMTVDVAAPGTSAADAKTALDLVAIKVPSINMRTVGDVGDNGGAVRLRGFSSLTQNGDPLIVIDDVVLRGAPPLEMLSRIPASDVDSIEILRGPAAAFRYPFASNGVIRVITRRN